MSDLSADAHSFEKMSIIKRISGFKVTIDSINRYEDLWFFRLKVFEILIEWRGPRVGRGAKYILGHCKTINDTM